MSKEPVDTLTQDAEGPTPRPREDSLTRELTRVEELNLAFYRAFEHRSLEEMAELWSRSPHARCVHPGWEPVAGWPGIRQSWLDIFNSMESITFELEDVHVEVSSDSAWVNLIAHAEFTTDDDETFSTSVVATTIFGRSNEQWAIVLHHSSHFVDEDEIDAADLDVDVGSGGGTFGRPGSSGDEQPN